MVDAPCALVENVCSAVVGTGAPYLPIWSNWLVVLFTSTFVLISVVKRRVTTVISAGGFVIRGLLAFVLCDLTMLTGLVGLQGELARYHVECPSISNTRA